MEPTVSAPKKLPLAWIIISLFVVVGVIAGLAYLNRPVSKTGDEAGVSQEAKAYLPNLELSDVSMKASENFMKQQVVEIEGKIRNKGPRPVQSIDVTCFFYGVDGREIYRERLPVVRSKGAPLATGETRSFRLPFDSLPDGWNQVMPRLVIAQLTFAQ
jgi:hypothetical protein